MSDSWRKYSSKGVCWYIEGEVDSWEKLGGKWIAWRRGFSGGTGGRKKLYMLFCHGCHIYGTWRRKEVGSVKVIILGWQATKRGSMFRHPWMGLGMDKHPWPHPTKKIFSMMDVYLHAKYQYNHSTSSRNLADKKILRLSGKNYKTL